MMVLLFLSLSSQLAVLMLCGRSSSIDAFHIPSRSILNHFSKKSSPVIIKQPSTPQLPALYASKPKSTTTTKSKRKKKNNNVDDISFSFTYDINKRSVLLKCLLVIILYMICGVICYSGGIFERWSVIDSLYFSVVTFTTVG